LSAGNKGFTLLELIIVILIAGISVSLVIVFVGRAHEKAVFKETSKKVFNVLKYAREVAIMEKATVTFKIGENNNSFWIEKNDVVYGRVQNIPERISISGESIMFFPKGNSSGGRIKIKDEKERGYYIEVDPVLGMPTVKGI